ncbi:hypothetical protein SEPCBS57363_006292 [Sporothrix epigloea]|uniref:Uncharacterized protein n=1 Tax=Sporothrix epigloea TaxID=1892477 RepID=A0ABP0E4W9_9PEZI
MAGAGVLPALVAKVAAPTATTTQVAVRAIATIQVLANTISGTTTATTNTAATATAAACWPDRCLPNLAVSFSPNSTDGYSQLLYTRGGGAFAGVFGLLALLHLVQGSHYRWKPAAATITAGLAAMAGHILQAIASASDIELFLQPYLSAAAFVLLQLPPLCITLYTHLMLKRLAHTRFLPAYDNLTVPVEKRGRQDAIWPSNSRWIAHWSITALLACAAAAQVVAIPVLVYGGLSTIFVGHVGHVLLATADLLWAAGLATQGIVVLVLLAAVTHAFVTLPPARPGGQQERGIRGAVPALSLPPRRRVQLLWLLGSTYGVLALLIMRLVYRTVEIVTAVKVVLAPEGESTFSGKSDRQMLWALMFEALPMCLALTLLSAFHAGWALPLRDVQHLRPAGEGGGGRDVRNDGSCPREEAEAGEASGIGGLFLRGPDQGLMPPNPRVSRSDLQPPIQSPAWILIQQRAIIQRQRQQQRQQWQRQWQLHAETMAAWQATQSVSLPSSPVLGALAQSSLSASLPVSLPRESFVAERPNNKKDCPEAAANTAKNQVSDSRPHRLARLSRDNFILFRFLNAAFQPPSSVSGGWRSQSRTTTSGSRWSRRTPHSNNDSAPSQGDQSLSDDPFVGFDEVAAAGRLDYDRSLQDQSENVLENNTSQLQPSNVQEPRCS